MDTQKKLLHVLAYLLVSLVLGSCGLCVKHIPQGEILHPTPNDRFVKVGAIQYHYTEYPGQGEDIVMIHGFASSTYTWEKVAPYLQREGYHVWTLDMKGFGWSDKPKDVAYDALTLMEDVHDWMSHMGLKDAVMVGNSLGGAVSALLAGTYPDKVSRMVLIDAGGYPMKLPTIVRMGRLPFAGSFVKLIYGRWMVKWNLREVMYHNDWITDEQVDAYYDRNRAEDALDTQVAVIRAIDFNAFDRFIARIPEVTARTLLIWGGEDAWVPLETVGKRFRKELPNSLLVVIPECGHIPQEEYPEITARLILDFLAGKPIKETPIPEQ